MSLGKIIGIIVAIPMFIFGVIPLILSSWTEGLVTESLLQAFGVNPIVIALVGILGFIILILAIFKLASAVF